MGFVGIGVGEKYCRCGSCDGVVVGGRCIGLICGWRVRG